MRHLGTAAFLFVMAACQAQLFTIHVRDEASTTVARGTLIEDLVGDLGFSEFAAMDVTDSTELQNQGVDPGDIQRVRLVSFELEAVDPPTADLAFLEALSLYVEAPGLPRVLLASASEFPVGEPLVALEVEDVDLTDYVISESLTLTTDVAGGRPSEDTEVIARYDLAVGVTGQGLCGGGE